MKKKLFMMMCVLLTIILAGCSNDDNSIDANDKERDKVLSYLQDKTWFFENKYSGGSIDESINYCFHSNGMLEVIDNSEYGPLFLASGIYEYDVQIHEQPNTDAIISGTLVFDNKHCTFEIHKGSENPEILSLGILYSTASSFSYYGFTLKK
jgi:hypothetical protein